jgi:LysM repeat protein
MTGIIALLLTSGALFSYEAMKGDDFNSIAQKTNCSVQELKDLNPHLNNKINEGDNVVIPEPIKEDNYYALQKGDTLSHVAAYLNISLDELLDMNPQIDRNKLHKLQIGQLINIGQHEVPKSVRVKKQEISRPSNESLNLDAVLMALREI